MDEPKTTAEGMSAAIMLDLCLWGFWNEKIIKSTLIFKTDVALTRFLIQMHFLNIESDLGKNTITLLDNNKISLTRKPEFRNDNKQNFSDQILLFFLSYPLLTQ